MGPEAGRSKKTGGSALGYKVSNNLPHRNPTRVMATRTLDPEKAADVIPSDEEPELSDGEAKQLPTAKTVAAACNTPTKHRNDSDGRGKRHAATARSFPRW
jgi:hypothetical protein